MVLAKKLMVIRYLTGSKQKMKSIKNVLVPANTIYFDVDEEFLLPHIRDSISTGLATGSTRLQAIENAALECIERDAITITWLNELSVPLIDSQTIPDETIQYYLKVADEKGFEVFFLI